MHASGMIKIDEIVKTKIDNNDFKKYDFLIKSKSFKYNCHLHQNIGDKFIWIATVKDINNKKIIKASFKVRQNEQYKT